MSKSLVLISTIFLLLFFIGCSGENNSTPIKTTEQDIVKEDVAQDSQTVVKVKVSKNAIETGESINYEVSDDSNIANIEWRDINGKLLSTEKKFNRFFGNEGSFVTVLTVTDKNGNLSTDTISIKVNRNNTPPQTSNKAPIVIVKAEALEIMDEEYIHLSDDGSYDSDGTIISYEWRDMDGILLSTTKKLDRKMYYYPQYDFNNDGTTRYVKTLYITDNKGAVSSKSFTIIVRKKPTPNQTPTVHAGEDQNITVGDSVILNAIANDSDGTIVSYEWKEGGVIKGDNATLILDNLSVGTHIFTVKVTDDDGAVNSDTVTVIVKEVVVINSPPVAEDINMTKVHGVAFDITLLGNDSDGDSLTYEIVNDPTQGGIAALNGNIVNFQPAAIYDQPDIFTYKVYDGKAYSNIATVRIIITATTVLNRIPWAHDMTAFFYSGLSQNKTVQLEGTDADGDSLTYEITQMPIGNVGTNYTFDPATGILSFTSIANVSSNVDIVKYKVYDGKEYSRIATAYIRFSFAPTTNLGEDKTITVGESITLIANAVDQDGTVEAYVWKVDGNEIAGAETLTLDGLVVGDHEVSLFVRDNDGLPSRIEKIIITVTATPSNAIPIVQNQDITTDEDTLIDVILSGTDTDNDTLTYAVVIPPSNGTLSGTAPNLIYTPDADYHGSDSFTYKANDGTVDSTPATVNITINPIDDFPVSNAGEDQSVEQGTTVTLDGSGSSTIDGAITTYRWSFSSKPAGSTATFSNINAVNPTFIPDVAGEYVIRLAVFDDQTFDGSNDLVTITATPLPIQSKLLKTGQTMSYDENGLEANGGTIKDDGYYQAGIDRNFTRDDVNRVVVDNVSGQIWQNRSFDGTDSYDRVDARSAYCPYVFLGGYLPTIEDLFYLENHAEGSFDTVFQYGTPNREYLSDTTDSEDSSLVWVMKYIDDLDGWAGQTDSAPIRCAKGGNPYRGNFSDNGDNTIDDSESNLMWQDNAVVADENNKTSWLEAIDYCEDLSFAGHSDWRLPNINELYSIGDRSRHNPAIRVAFTNVVSRDTKDDDYYWSSTSATQSFLAQAVEFRYGNTTRLEKVALNGNQQFAYVRCVRDK